MNSIDHIIEQVWRAQRQMLEAQLASAVDLAGVRRATETMRAAMSAEINTRCEQLENWELVALQSRLIAQCDDWVFTALAAVMKNQMMRLTEFERRDAVTGLGNRSAFDARLREEIGRARRYGRSLALALLDVDDFKAINDRLGHPVGDQMLASLAHTLQSSLRSTDAVFRYGGDEFAALSPETSAAALTAALQRAAHDRRASKAASAVLAVSCGVASFPHDATSETELLCIADERLYIDKRARQAQR